MFRLHGRLRPNRHRGQVHQIVRDRTARLYGCQPLVQGGLIDIGINLERDIDVFVSGPVIRLFAEQFSWIERTGRIDGQGPNRKAHLFGNNMSHHIETAGQAGQDILNRIRSLVIPAQARRLVNDQLKPSDLNRQASR